MDTTTSVKNRKLTFDDSVIKKIAGTVASDIEGILSMNGGFLSDIADRFRSDTNPTKGIGAEVGERQVALDMEATLEYGADAQQIFDQLCDQIHTSLKQMTGLELVELNLNVIDIMSKREWANHTKEGKEETKDRVS
ncbi:Asp23/Gls24 family envelope stress response protein [Loigolactobacillus backii]|uniref:Stress response regulator gls24 homolog n=1 Tax=Loigolactobacillus backii TaxID=375175 RepID=A0A192H052_9LACO|nr:Asp23/Gls24 family envelope stress response protein [Loigolactobacillus backii]ANK61617.1 alkaline-shock protein [Loigolactobacillus backii]ANK65766.1 alkaline-shock protein [Loigolactobacillus backii]ANK68242.1 alkaline-shock protein [Loigolactobacillus backii]ANK69183.1 alkaline-shock protein [Loigolactobacillus backii]MDA5388355.1 Asp23/Gls24 family envelope stress response protein [Loigolactobacillus backii]